MSEYEDEEERRRQAELKAMIEAAVDRAFEKANRNILRLLALVQELETKRALIEEPTTPTSGEGGEQ